LGNVAGGEFCIGKTLYETFFAPYTSKFLRCDAEDIHSDWASTGINRTIIDKRVNANTLQALLKSLILPSKIETEFLYPSTGGFGGFYDRLVAMCARFSTFDLLLSDQITTLEKKDQGLFALTKNEQSFDFDQLIWTGNLNDLGKIISSERKVRYLNTVFYNLVCKKEGVSNARAQWIYVSKGDALISRITCMSEFAPYTCHPDYYNFICEVTDSQASPRYFQNPEIYVQGVLDELISMRFLKAKKYVETVHVNSVQDTYPIYHKEYNRDFGKSAAAIKKFSSKIHLLGRSGAFWYNNSDHSIRFAIEMAAKLLQKSEKDFNYRNYFGGTYQSSPELQEV